MVILCKIYKNTRKSTYKRNKNSSNYVFFLKFRKKGCWGNQQPLIQTHFITCIFCSSHNSGKNHRYNTDLIQMLSFAPQQYLVQRELL